MQRHRQVLTPVPQGSPRRPTTNAPRERCSPSFAAITPDRRKRRWRRWAEGMRNEEMEEDGGPGPPPQNALFPLSFPWFAPPSGGAATPL